ncbi:uncharacterized protein js [Battus philenor]|uniref:uncharacterized protein js n=1 Tax=Battus philenor TaxID=42288 RepID=UPI0035CE9F04
MDTGCQVYHMCDGMGRQFSYSCPNTTLFQQRMLVCDHWYMVNCSKAESDYDANLLIGQRDKPFVSDEDMRSRTPRPNVLSVPPNSNYYEGLREAETKFPIHPGNSIVGIADSISDDNNDLDDENHDYRPTTLPSTTEKTEKIFGNKNGHETNDSIKEASRGNEPIFLPTPNDNTENIRFHIPPPSKELSPPLRSTEPKAPEGNEDSVFNFIKRFDPNDPDSHKTSMTKTEIIDINRHLPSGQVSSEEDRTPRKNKLSSDTFNRVQIDRKKSSVESTRFNSVNIKAGKTTESSTDFNDHSEIPVPDKHLLPPKREYSQVPSTTMGPPIYYEWKWAVPALDLEPPKENNITNTTAPQHKRTAQGKRPFSDVTRTTTTPATPTPQNTEYNISSYFVPDYVFPLDKQHPGYEEDNAETSFHVRISKPGRASYGENSNCPHCHPAYLRPGTCEPCIVKR